jgi:hypothetical protein
MALKRSFNDDEKIGLSRKEVELGEKYLRKHKTAGAIEEVESLKLYEMFLIGNSIHEIHKQFSQYDLGQICLTAAIRKWGLDRDKMQCSLKDRVQTKVIKSIIDQVDFLTNMLGVANAEHLEEMRNYILDANAPKPNLRIKSIKDYKDITETLGKLVQGGGNGKNPSMLEAVTHQPKKELPKPEKKDEDEDIDLDSLTAKKDKE